jgi:hypothetical protein
MRDSMRNKKRRLQSRDIRRLGDHHETLSESPDMFGGGDVIEVVTDTASRALREHLMADCKGGVSCGSIIMFGHAISCTMVNVHRIATTEICLHADDGEWGR